MLFEGGCMEPESPTSVPVSPSNEIRRAEETAVAALTNRDLARVFIGPGGLRSGWSVAIFVALIVLLGSVASAIARAIHPPSRSQEMSPGSGLVGEVMSVALLILATWIVALIERRKLLDYNLHGPRRGFHFA